METFWAIIKHCDLLPQKKLTPNIKSGSWTFRVRAAVSSLYLRVFMAFIFGLLMSCLEFQTIALQFNLVGLEFLTRKNVFLAKSKALPSIVLLLKENDLPMMNFE